MISGEQRQWDAALAEGAALEEIGSYAPILLAVQRMASAWGQTVREAQSVLEHFGRQYAETMREATEILSRSLRS